MRLRDLVRPGTVAALSLGIALLGAGCRSHRADDARSGPETIYARAQKAMKNSSYGEAIKQLEALQSRFPFSEPVPVKLIERIAKFRAKEVAAREKTQARKNR